MTHEQKQIIVRAVKESIARNEGMVYRLMHENGAVYSSKRIDDCNEAIKEYTSILNLPEFKDIV